MTNLHFVVTKKGGGGKSVLEYNFACLASMMEAKALFICADHESRTSMKQIKFTNIEEYNLMNANDQLDRQEINNLIEKLIDQKKYDHVFIDFGGSGSEQLVKYFANPANSDFLIDIKDECNIFIHSVILGGNSYSTCADYCEEIFEASKGYAYPSIFLNKFIPFTDAQLSDIGKLADKYKSDVRYFTIIGGPVGVSTEAVYSYMQQGKNALKHERRAVRLPYKRSLLDMQFEF